MLKLPDIPEAEESQSMSAMTDVVFLLLIFFIVTMSAYVETTLLETKLPTASSSSGTPDLSNVVRIDIPAPQNDQYLYVINGNAQSASQLDKLLSRYQRLMPEAEFEQYQQNADKFMANRA